jgi:hypothetical protein
MRASSILAIAVTAATVFASAQADAKTRYRYRAPARAPLIVPVEPRSFLDPGPIPPIGTYSRYVYVSQYSYFPPYGNNYSWGQPPLPNYGNGGRPQFEGLSFGPLSGYR